MNTFEHLSHTEQQSFLKFPAYIWLLAANAYETDDKEKQTAVDLEHIKKFTCEPRLNGFYANAELVFKDNLEELDNELPKAKLQREVAIKVELRKIKELLRKFDPAYAVAMYQSMKSFKEHVSNAHHNILEDFLFPIPISGLTD